MPPSNSSTNDPSSPLTSVDSSRESSLEPSNQIIELNSSECVTFDALLDPDYPPDLITENLLRILCYEGDAGFGELTSLILKSAGYESEYNLLLSNQDIQQNVNQIEDHILRTDSAPAEYPLLKSHFQKRVSKIISVVFNAMYASDQTEVMQTAISYIIAFTQLRIQSLRHVGCIFLSGVCLSLDTPIDLREEAMDALKMRCNDVSLAIRKQAVQVLIQLNEFHSVKKLLNDSKNTVRVSLLRDASANKELELDSDEISKIAVLAVRDVDVSVRRSALRCLIVHATQTESDAEIDIYPELLDTDLNCQKLAAEFILTKLSKSTLGGSKAILALLADLMESSSSAEEVKHKINKLEPGFEKSKSKLKLDIPVEIGKMLTTDYNKELKSRKSASQKANLRELSKETSKPEVQEYLLELMSTALPYSSGASSVLIDCLPSLALKLQHNEHLYSLMLQMVAKLPFTLVFANASTQTSLESLLDNIKMIFKDRTSIPLLESCGSVFMAIPEFDRNVYFSEVYHELRLSLAEMLGSRGELNNDKQTEYENLVNKLLVFAKFYDCSDILRLQITKLLENHDLSTLKLVRAIGLNGDADVMENVVTKLEKLKWELAVDVILEVYIVAKMRNIELEKPLPVDTQELAPSSNSIWTAAVAAGVI